MAFLNKTFFKFSCGALVLVGLGLLFLYAPVYWQRYQVDRAIFELERPYREDIYGGKTPEETFDMFLGAMREGDLDLASKYFVVGKQGEYLEKFQGMRDGGKLNAQIQEWERARKEWVKVVDEYNDWKGHAVVRYSGILEDRIVDERFGIPIVFEPGEYAVEIVFDLNKVINVWKISRF